jgi:hypothetical protein
MLAAEVKEDRPNAIAKCNLQFAKTAIAKL